jgi:hypothetical protein
MFQAAPRSLVAFIALCLLKAQSEAWPRYLRTSSQLQTHCIPWCIVHINKTEVPKPGIGLRIIQASCQVTCARRPELDLGSLPSFVPSSSPLSLSFILPLSRFSGLSGATFYSPPLSFQGTTMACVNPNPADTLTTRLNQLLSTGGNGYVLNLCPSQQYIITQPILFAAPNQEISTQGYPTGGDRATLVVDGPVSNGTGHTTAVDGTCATCSGVKLRNVQVRSYSRSPSRAADLRYCQINGTRAGAPPTQGGANIEMGGGNSGQLVRYLPQGCTLQN